MALSETSIEPSQCPFCGTEIASPGAGFMRHVENEPECRDAFDTWRDRVTDDMRGGWAGVTATPARVALSGADSAPQRLHGSLVRRLPRGVRPADDPHTDAEHERQQEVVAVRRVEHECSVDRGRRGHQPGDEQHGQ